MSLGLNIRYLRKVNNLSRDEFAVIIGKSSSTVGYYETNKADPPHKILIGISNKFGVSVDDLLKKDLNSEKGYNLIDQNNAILLEEDEEHTNYKSIKQVAHDSENSNLQESYTTNMEKSALLRENSLLQDLIYTLKTLTESQKGQIEILSAECEKLKEELKNNKK